MISQDTEQLLVNALAVIDKALDRKKYGVIHEVAPLFSGGHDSYCACFVASKHKRFRGHVYHINTGIGSRATREFVEEVCKLEGWKLRVLKSKDTYEQFIRDRGFPGPAMHLFAYNRLKDRCINQITRSGHKHHRTILVTGCRSAESVRRMGHVEPIKVGERQKDGKQFNMHRIWVAPCHNWSSQDQRDFMDLYNLPRNPVKESILGMSGECFCGAFARPNELDMIRQVCPDVAAEIDRLRQIAIDCGHHTTCVWGRKPTEGEVVLETGPLCTSCDNKARQVGIVVQDVKTSCNEESK